MQSDGLFFGGILLFFFILWFATGGPSKPISFAGPFITPITNVGQKQQGYGPTDGVNLNTPQSQVAVHSQLTDIAQKISQLRTQSATMQQFGPVSPYKDQVTIEKSSGGPAGTTVKTEYVTIRASYSAKSDITVTGWTLVSAATGKSARIPSGTRILSTGDVNPKEAIVLRPGDAVTISTGESPVGTSFKENMCVGYLTHYQTFYPPIQTRCPSPMTEFNQYYTGNALRDDGCYNLINSLSSCRVPSDSGRISSYCLSFIDNYLTYGGCVASHRYDPNFEGTQWYVYLGRTDITRNNTDTEFYGELWKPTREGIKLLDQNGLTVDQFIY